MNKFDLTFSIQSLESQLSKASMQFDEWVHTENDWYDPSWHLESCFLHLLIICESLNLNEFHKMIQSEYLSFKESKKGFSDIGFSPDGDPYPRAIGRIRCYSRALENLFINNKETTITKDLLQIIRDIHYVITDTSVFSNIPENEDDVHVRIEAVLKCVFPDLKHKPVLTKQIKNFIPDTGIPSLQTLIEYKYLSKKSDVGIVADQLLADTRGYVNKEWKRFLYVIYETHRFRTEKDWNLFLREAEVSNETSIVVLGGEAPENNRKEKKANRKKAQQNV